MSKAIVFVYLFSTVMLACGDERAQLIFANSEYDLGLLEEGRSYVFDISLENKTGHSLRVLSLKPSCGCTKAIMVNKHIRAGEEGIVKVAIDTTGKIGKMVKIIEVMTDISGEPFELKLTAMVEHSGDGVVNANVVFREGCRRCHVGKNIQSERSEVLLNAVCFMCHKDYSSFGILDEKFLRESISDGVPNTSMPGFAKANGGPLTTEQVDSLVEFLKQRRSK